MDLLFIWITVALLVFLVKQLYVGVRYGEVGVRTGVYTRQRTPILYWAAMLTVLAGISVMLLVIASCVAFAFW